MKQYAAGLANSAEIRCGPEAPQTAGEAANAMAGDAGDLTALPAAPKEGVTTLVETPPPAAQPASEPPPAAPPVSPSLLALFMARVAAWQTKFNLALTGGLKDLKSGAAFWWLGGISFLYGIVHAAGPGHGKVVISSYLVANEARVRRGVGIAFIAAFAQAVVAVGLIGVMAVILNMTSMAITGTAKLFEAGSFALVALLGFYLLVRKGREAWAVLGGDAHAHRHAHHGHAQCHHNVAPIATRPGPSGAAAAILSVGIRPCSGALVVLVFALAQGVFWAGVASTFLMALGTATTVAALAALAVGAKDIARRLARGDGNWSARIMLGLELAAALFITALGVMLFSGALYA
jgi:ABC-type nickel/cobalt efflux system permease component RcnA